MHHQSPRGGIKGKMFFVLFLNRKSHHFNVWRFLVDYAEILPLDWTVQCTQSQVRVSFFQMSNLTSRYFNTLQNLISLRCRTDFVCSVLSLEPGATDLCDEWDGTASEQTSQRPWASGDDGDEDRHNQNQTDRKEDDGDDGGMEQESPYFLTHGWNNASLKIG